MTIQTYLGAYNPHYKCYCDYCECATVICGKCGNNTCNGGYGEIPGPEPFTMIKCDACESAYELFYKKE